MLLLLLCSHSPNDISPEPQRNVSIAAVRGAVRPSNFYVVWGLLLFMSYGDLPFIRSEVVRWCDGAGLTSSAGLSY